MLDKNKKGTLSITDITKIVKTFCSPMAKEEEKTMIPSVVTYGVGYIMLIEKKVHNLRNGPAFLGFKNFDKSDDGKINGFRYILTHIG